VYELLTGSTQGEGKGKVTTVWSIGIFMYVIILKWKGQRHPSQCYVAAALFDTGGYISDEELYQIVKTRKVVKNNNDSTGKKKGAKKWQRNNT
jgi:hypothetical protein